MPTMPTNYIPTIWQPDSIWVYESPFCSHFRSSLYERQVTLILTVNRDHFSERFQLLYGMVELTKPTHQYLQCNLLCLPLSLLQSNTQFILKVTQKIGKRFQTYFMHITKELIPYLVGYKFLAHNCLIECNTMEQGMFMELQFQNL